MYYVLVMTHRMIILLCVTSQKPIKLARWQSENSSLAENSRVCRCAYFYKLCANAKVKINVLAVQFPNLGP